MHETPFHVGLMTDILPRVPAVLEQVENQFGPAFSGVVLSDSIDPGYGSELLDRSMVDADTVLDRCFARWGDKDDLSNEVCTVKVVRERYFGVVLVIDWCDNQPD